MESNSYSKPQMFLAWLINKIVILIIWLPWGYGWFELMTYGMRNLSWYVGIPVVMAYMIVFAYGVMTPWFYIQKKMKHSKSAFLNMLAYQEMNADERASYKP